MECDSTGIKLSVVFIKTVEASIQDGSLNTVERVIVVFEFVCQHRISKVAAF